MNKNLENFYSNWSDKSDDLVQYDNACAVRKVDALVEGLPILKAMNFDTVVDFGCGYGKALQNFKVRHGVKKAYGFDFSESAIAHARKFFSESSIEYHQLQTLDIEKNIVQIKMAMEGNKADCIMLFDLLEHVPDCVQLVTKLSEIGTHFLIKLPIEEVFLNNYLLKKTYPSTTQSNGHLREFTVNSVHYFIRRLGLTPLAEGVHIYNFRDSFPPQPAGGPRLAMLKRHVLKTALIVLAALFPKRIYIRLFGPGSYYCLATFSAEHILRP